MGECNKEINGVPKGRQNLAHSEAVGKETTPINSAPEGRQNHSNGEQPMAHTYVQLLTHIVFSTKNREPFLTPELRERLFPYMGGIFRGLDSSALLINGVSDHVHILALLPAKRALSDIMRDVKANSSGWVHEQFPRLKKFAWQTGYGAFSVSKSNLEVVREYIANQEKHHKRKTFQEEFIGLLKKHGIEYDERFIWD